MASRRLFPALAAASALVVAACASAEPEPRAPEAPAATTPILSGLGSYHFPIATRSPEAQRYFDQGLRLVYAFNHDEARAAFEEAARRDPTAPMPYWGVALTLGPNINLPTDPAREKAAYAAIQRARALAGNGSAKERAYIEALAQRYSADGGGDRTARDLAYAEAMRRLARAYPDDLDAATLSAEAMMDLRPWDLWTPDGKPQPGTEEIVNTLERVMAKDPNHPGANHYYIHAVEASPNPERALPSAERLGRLMPGAGHIVHMPSHIYMRVGRYDDATDANLRAAAVDRAYIAARQVSGVYPMMYYTHNLHFIATAAGMEGWSAAAIRAADDVVAQVPDELIRAMPMAEVFRPTRLFTLVRFGRWADVLAEPAPPAEQKYTTAIWHFARGLALARAGRVDEAKSELQDVERARAAIPDELMLGQNSGSRLLQIAADMLAGELAAEQGDASEAVRRLEAAARVEDALKYNEPPDWPLPVRHWLGAELLRSGRAAQAELVYRDDLVRNPQNGWALLGLSQSLAAQGKGEEASRARSDSERAFRRADVTPPTSRF